MKKDFKVLDNEVKIESDELVLVVTDTWMCCHQGIGELENVNHGRFKRFQFRAGDRIKDSGVTKDWLNTEFENKSAGCTNQSDSSSPFFLFKKFNSYRKIKNKFHFKNYFNFEIVK